MASRVWTSAEQAALNILLLCLQETENIFLGERRTCKLLHISYPPRVQTEAAFQGEATVTST